MTNLLRHRGPDDTGVFVDGAIGFGFARLSMIDLSNGKQPMRSLDGRFTLVFNGEIYNYKELQLSLKKRGYSFRTNSDTEVLLALFELGVPLPEEVLHGMFAFAIFDSRENRLILSRDRMGKKPLFWAQTTEGIAFGSEIKSILSIPAFVNKPNWHSLSDFLTLSYCPAIGSNFPETAFEGVYHVPAGGRLEIKHKINKRIWWELPSYPEHKKDDKDEWEREILDTLTGAVKRRLISDSSLGIFLSGGLDSSLILALISKIGFPRNFVAFTASFDNQSYDETGKARQLAEHFNVPHVSVSIEPKDVERVFRDVVYKSDNLVANPAIFANYLLSETASQTVKGVFHGGGGDELFFGYPTYRADTIAKHLGLTPKIFRKLVALSALPWPVTYKKLGLKYKIIKFLEGLEHKPHKRHYWWRTIFTEKEKDILLSELVPRQDSFRAYQHAYNVCESDVFYEQAAFADMSVWWKDMGLYQGDVMSMANSLELRMPFMDQELVELMARVPLRAKMNGYQQKAMMKSICKGILPQKVIGRPKSGFHIPLAEWFAGPLKDFVAANLSDERIKCVPGLNSAYVQQTIHQHLCRQFDNSFKITSLLVLVEWYHQFILNEKE